MKVRWMFPAAARMGRPATVFAAAIALLLLFGTPAPAHAITRDEVVARGTSWVKARVGYSQRAYYGGYRRDCSGMVSMSWKLGTSLSSRTISSRARRISISSLKPGDAVLTPGHVALFAGWANRRAGTYVALEQSTRRTGAIRRVRSLGRGAVALRYRGITEPVPPAPVPEIVVAIVTVTPEPTATPVMAATSPGATPTP
ncbi:MAG TPA: hypothetical protein VF902_10225 [Coriobacteriia bacterium]